MIVHSWNWCPALHRAKTDTSVVDRDTPTLLSLFRYIKLMAGWCPFFSSSPFLELRQQYASLYSLFCAVHSPLFGWMPSNDRTQRAASTCDATNRAYGRDPTMSNSFPGRLSSTYHCRGYVYTIDGEIRSLFRGFFASSGRETPVDWIVDEHKKYYALFLLCNNGL